MCKGGGSPYKLVGTGEKSQEYFWTTVLSKTINIFEGPSKFSSKGRSKPHCPPTYSAAPYVKNQTKSLPSMGSFLCESEITIIEQELPTLS